MRDSTLERFKSVNAASETIKTAIIVINRFMGRLDQLFNNIEYERLLG